MAEQLNRGSPLRFGQPALIFSAPSGTDWVQVYPLGGATEINGRTWLLSMTITWLGTAAASVAINDGTNDNIILNAKSGGATDDPYIFEASGVILPGTHLLKVKTSVADLVQFMAAMQFSTG